MTDLPQNPVDAILTLLGVKPDDNRWNLPEVRQWRAHCDALVRDLSDDEAATFEPDEVSVSVPLPALLRPAEEPAETEAERVARLSALQQRLGKLL